MYGFPSGPGFPRVMGAPAPLNKLFVIVIYCDCYLPMFTYGFLNKARPSRSRRRSGGECHGAQPDWTLDTEEPRVFR